MEGRRSVAKYDIDDPRFRIHPSQQIVSACTGALLTSLSMTPLDVVKTRLQTQQKLLLSNKCYLYCNGLMDHLCPCGPNGSISQKPHLNGTIDAFVKISRTEGVRALWSGLSPTLVLAVPTTVIYFVAYEQLRVRAKDKYMDFRPGSTSTPWLIPLVAGGLARVIAASIVSPLELVRTKMQSQRVSYLEVGQALKSMVNTQGIWGLWTGLRSTLMRDVPFSGLYWTSYETLKAIYGITGSPSVTFSFIGGALSGSIAAIVTTPFDVVKTHKQIELGENLIYTDTPKKIPKRENVLPALEKIYKLHGIRGLFAGLIPRLVKVAPACAIMLSSFEYGKAFFHQHNVVQFHSKSEA
ncbi:probable mitochondrial glutathione transporter SLC25A40 [Phlebotomus argentipes]|uniref:probable mitochondrial glutathione transporter SLC25A40 n=1 Tax=Phlebotomus argentipes TaxID=94469 RepID=UPI002893835B|nr:probable mitochondrial glutathione transporter SLC25A40 [Phlebotomus argentipes]